MPEPSEVALVAKLLLKTQQNQVEWQPTLLFQDVSANFLGKYIINLRRTAGGTTEMTVKNSAGDQLAFLTSNQMGQIRDLYELAKGYARKVVDDQLDEIVKELDKPLSPAETQADRARLIDKIRREKGQ